MYTKSSRKHEAQFVSPRFTFSVYGVCVYWLWRGVQRSDLIVSQYNSSTQNNDNVVRRYDHYISTFSYCELFMLISREHQA